MDHIKLYGQALQLEIRSIDLYQAGGQNGRLISEYNEAQLGIYMYTKTSVHAYEVKDVHVEFKYVENNKNNREHQEISVAQCAIGACLHIIALLAFSGEKLLPVNLIPRKKHARRHKHTNSCSIQFSIFK